LSASDSLSKPGPWAARSQPQTIRDCPDCPELVLVPAGSFRMGATIGEEDTENVPFEFRGWAYPRHTLHLAAPFYLGLHHVTRGEFSAFVKSSGHDITGWYAYGVSLSAEGVVHDVRENSAAWRAGLAPGMRILAVNNQQFSADVLEYAVKRAQHSTAPISLIVTQTGWYQTLSLDYHEGIRYPHLERITGVPDMLAAIAAPRATPQVNR